MITTPSWITFELFPGTTGLYWKIIKFEFFDVGDPDNDGSTNAYASMFDQNSAPAGNAVCWSHNGGDMPLRTDLKNDFMGPRAEAVIPMTKDSNFDPTHGQHGPYSMDVKGLNAVGSDVIHGMGLIGSRHIQYRTTFQLTEAGTAPVTPSPTDLPVMHSEFEQLLRDTLTKILTKG